MSENFSYIEDLGNHVGTRVTVRGWLVHKRSSGKKIKFLVVRDGTGLLQCVVFHKDVAPEVLEACIACAVQAPSRRTSTRGSSVTPRSAGVVSTTSSTITRAPWIGEPVVAARPRCNFIEWSCVVTDAAGLRV